MKLKSAVLINALKVAFTQLKTNMSSTDDAVVFTQQTKMIAEQLAKLKIKTDSIGVDNAAVFTQQLKMVTAQLAKIKLQMEEGEFVIFPGSLLSPVFIILLSSTFNPPTREFSSLAVGFKIS